MSQVRRALRWRLVVIAALGLALVLYLVAYVGLAAVLSAASGAGWGGFAILCLYSLVVFFFLGLAWYTLMPVSSGVGLWVFVRARMVRDAASEVLPFSQIGGIVIGARAAIVQGVSPALAFGSTIVDVTTELLAQIGFVALCVVILTAQVPHSSQVASLTKVCVIGLVVAAVAGGLFLSLQRYGHRITGSLASRLLQGVGAATAAVGETFDGIYRSPARVGLSVAVHFAGWVSSAIGAWIAFRLIGVRIDLLSVIAIEGLVYAARSAAAFVPNALGVQEGTYAVLAPLFGVGPEFALAVSLLKRARDIAVGVPILLIWQAAEGQRALAGRPSGNP